METNRSFLLSKAMDFELGKQPGVYDQAVDLKMVMIGTENIPLVTTDMAPPTESKTFAAPGDDDPDVECEKCY